MSKYAQIIERLESAQCGDRELDGDLAVRFDGFITRDEFGMAGNWWTRFMRDGVIEEAPRYTASIDAALTLVERMFSPGYYRVEKLKGLPDPRHQYWATAGASGEQEDAYAPTAPLAILRAMFNALEAKEHGHER